MSPILVHDSDFRIARAKEKFLFILLQRPTVRAELLSYCYIDTYYCTGLRRRRYNIKAVTLLDNQASSSKVAATVQSM